MPTRRNFGCQVFILGMLLGGCAPAIVKPQASDWSRRKLNGVSLEAPYAFTGNNNALPGVVNVASYKPDSPNMAIDIRVDVLQPPIGTEATSLDQFANAMFALVDTKNKKFQSGEVIKLQIDGLDARRNKATSSTGAMVES